MLLLVFLKYKNRDISHVQFWNTSIWTVWRNKTLISRSVYWFHFKTSPSMCSPPSLSQCICECAHTDMHTQVYTYIGLFCISRGWRRKLSPERFKLDPIRSFITETMKYQEGFLCCVVLNVGLYWKVNKLGSNLHWMNTQKTEAWWVI